MLRGAVLTVAVVISLAAIGASTSAVASGEGRTTAITPHPDRAAHARGPLPRDGCFLGKGEFRSPRCAYGATRSKRRVVLFGDSHAMHYYPGLRPLLRERNWKLTVLTKAGCGPMPIVKRRENGQPTECAIWRRSALRRIEARPPRMVITGASVNYRVRDRSGNVLPRDEGKEALEQSYRQVLRRIGRTGARRVVMRDVPKAPFDVPSCVAENLEQPEECKFDLRPGHYRNFDTQAARAVGAMIVDMTGVICENRRCRAVVDNRLVYRAGSHLTAPFARLLREPLARQMPDLR